MGSTKEGLICQLDQARGMNKALERMVKDMISKTKDCENRVLAIAHCNCPERAKAVKEKIEKIAKFKKIIIINTACLLPEQHVPVRPDHRYAEKGQDIGAELVYQIGQWFGNGI